MREIEWTENSEKQDSVPVLKGFIMGAGSV